MDNGASAAAATDAPLLIPKSFHDLLVPELDHPVMQGGEDPWADGVEAQPLDAVAFVFKLDQHPLVPGSVLRIHQHSIFRNGKDTGESQARGSRR